MAVESRVTARRPIRGTYGARPPVRSHFAVTSTGKCARASVRRRSAFAAGAELGDGVVVVDDRGRGVEVVEAFHQPGPENRLGVEARPPRPPAAHVDPVGVEAFRLPDGIEDALRPRVV